MAKERWTTQVLQRYGTNVLVLYDEDTSVGSINVDDDDIEIWMTAIRVLNLEQHNLKKIQERLDLLDS